MQTIKYILVIITTVFFLSCGEKTSSTESPMTKTTNGITSSTFKVWGNCEMCKETIEGSLKVGGIAKADWNVDTKIMSVNFDSTKISLDKIQKNIAMVGYDNEKFKGDDKAYSELPDCCQYDRK
jgi:mercuric ion binding protein